MIKMYNIDTVVAVGNKAEENLRNLNIICKKVRHPAQGGKNEFVRGIKEIKESLILNKTNYYLINIYYVIVI